jgi:hypothetical protein
MSIISAPVARARIDASTTASRPADVPSTPTPIRCGAGAGVVPWSARRLEVPGMFDSSVRIAYHGISLRSERVKGRHTFCVIVGPRRNHPECVTTDHPPRGHPAGMFSNVVVGVKEREAG